MTYPPSGGAPDPYQPSQPYGQPADPTTPYNAPPEPPVSGQPGYPPPPTSGQPYQQGQPDPYAQPNAYGPPPNAYGQQPGPYGQPGGYGQPGPYGQPVYVPVASTNTLAILALVFAFVFSPAAIVLGHLAKKQIRQTGEQGEGLATAGLWLGYIFTGLGVLVCIGYVIIIAVAVGNGATTTY
ncbi:hypothetical protein BJ973_007814 [Actinoplanes tereljensis]|uniref:DUF4190 domain-containing protein n=1 Tax=Paractinoplanes tereljensis TaxID=571912 RepID=A0A919TXM0_9ACTN|nr:DUF4190 domain-containing protein [Actinoplanes tereljensis]GIF24335.1 hypothetical protein Ate02nite_70650 [Actinoplanes tereljensis]